MKLKTLLCILLLCLVFRISSAHIGLGLFQFNPGKTISLTHKSTVGFEISYKTSFNNYSRFHLSFNYTNLNPAADTVYQEIRSTFPPAFYTSKLIYDKMNIIDINVGADFTPLKNKDINPYAGFLFGISNQEYTFETYQEGAYGNFKQGYAETSAQLKFGVGVNLVFTENLNFDLDYRYLVDFYENANGNRNSTFGLSMNWRII